MKASDITQAGFYWLSLPPYAPGVVEILLAEDLPWRGYVCYPGSEQNDELAAAEGEFVGPIEPPARPAA